MDAYERLLRQIVDPHHKGHSSMRTRGECLDSNIAPRRTDARTSEDKYVCPACSQPAMFPEHGHFRCLSCHHVDHCCEGHLTQPRVSRS